jgi:hypothetical protein
MYFNRLIYLLTGGVLAVELGNVALALSYKLYIFLEDCNLTLPRTIKQSISLAEGFKTLLAFTHDIRLRHSSEYVRCGEYNKVNSATSQNIIHYKCNPI